VLVVFLQAQADPVQVFIMHRFLDKRANFVHVK